MKFTFKVLTVLIVVLPASFSDTQNNEEGANAKRPHIIFIVADDLGWNDVGFHGSDQIPTANIDALAYSGLILNNYYVSPICTPSRSALMTGKHPIHTGMQHGVLYGAEPRGLPLSEKLLPEYLAELGYTNHIVGKWHLGSYKKEYTPLYRGFQSHTGYWTGHHDYYDHSAVETGFWGFDMRRGMDVAWDLHGKYSTDIFTDESVRIIRGHNSSRPLFLYIGHVAVHSANPYSPLPAPDELVAKFTTIEDFNRRKFAAIMTKLDESVGKVVAALQSSKMLENSLIVFTTDNGGPAAGFNSNAASNWPLRGVKNTLWEGGVRGAGLIWSTQLHPSHHVSKQLMHISDWLPTLLSAAQGDTSVLENIDGVDMWESLLSNSQSNRTEVLHNIDSITGSAALTVGKWKIVQGTHYNGQWDGWYGPSGRPDGHTPAYNITLIACSSAGRAVRAAGRPVNLDQVEAIRDEAGVTCFTGNITDHKPCYPLEAPCLFNIRDDPCEINNLAERFPQVLAQLSKQLSRINETAVPPGNLPVDPRGNPNFWDHTFTNFGDYTVTVNNIS
ncbi:arylsulfatase I [Nilaparvata lugens]|uniref:arylsulfatase I n=1 Tax=Nilaparvata lugens TaxID=108931 RepID=UPI00193D7AB1|nr:arylsulfatase I [Nilaparvata lugens]